MNYYVGALCRIAELDAIVAPPRRVRGYRPVDVDGRKNPAHAEWMGLWINGETCAQIAESNGVIAETVRQVVKAKVPKSLWMLARRRELARRRLRQIVDSNPRWCVVCGRQILGKGTRACSPECQSMRLLLLYHVTPGRKEAHRLAVNKFNADRAADEYQRRYSAEVLAGERQPEPRFGGDGWLVEGSKAWDVAVLAHKNGWPIFDALPERIRQQVAGTLPAKGETRECVWCGKEFWTDYDQKTCSRECRLARLPSLRPQKVS